MKRVWALWIPFLVVWSATQLEWSAVRPYVVAGAAAALAALHLVSMRLLPEPLRLSCAANLFLAAVAAVFVIQLLPVAPLLFPYTEGLRRTHGTGSLWPATADLELTVVSLAQVSTYVLSALLVLRLRQAGLPSSTLLKGVCAVLVLQGLYGLAQSIFGFRELPFGRERTGLEAASGTLVNRNSFAALMAMGLSGAIALAFRNLYYGRHDRDRGVVWEKRIETGLLWGLAAGLFALDIALARSRGGAMAAAAAVLAFAFLARGRPRGAAVAAVLAILVGAVLLANPRALVDRFRSLDPQEISSEARWEYWRTTAAAAVRHPVLGFGVGTHRWAYHPFQPPTVVGQIEHAHNEYINAFFEGGAVWLLVLAGGLAVWFVRAGSRLRGLAGPDRVSIVAAMAAVTAIAVHSLVDFDLRITPLGMLFGAMVALGASRSAASPGPARAAGWGAPAAGLAAAAAIFAIPMHPDPPVDEEACRRTLGVSPYDYAAAWKHAWTAVRREDLAEADRRIGVAADLCPSNPALQRDAGLWFWEAYERSNDRGDLLKSARCLGRLFLQQPTATSGVMEEIWDESRPAADYETLLPESPMAAGELAAYLVSQGRWKEGMDLFERRCAARAENAGAFDLFAAALERVGQWGLEARVRERRLAVKADAWAYAAVSQAWLRLKVLDRALERATVASRIDPARGDWHAIRAEVLRAKGDRLLALEAYGHALAASPREHAYRLARAGLYRELGMHGLAVDDFREVLRSRPADRVAIVGAARSMAALGDASSARNLIQFFLTRNPDDAEVRRVLEELR